MAFTGLHAPTAATSEQKRHSGDSSRWQQRLSGMVPTMNSPLLEYKTLLKPMPCW